MGPRARAPGPSCSPRVFYRCRDVVSQSLPGQSASFPLVWASQLMPPSRSTQWWGRIASMGGQPLVGQLRFPGYHTSPGASRSTLHSLHRRSGGAYRRQNPCGVLPRASAAATGARWHSATMNEPIAPGLVLVLDQIAPGRIILPSCSCLGGHVPGWDDARHWE